VKILLRKANTAMRLAEGQIHRLNWRLHNPRPTGSARPLWIVGAQRSGTTMLGDCVGRSAAVEYYPEHDRRAFDAYELREDRWRNLVARSRQSVVAFKPLTSSHRAAAMLAEYPEGRVVWMLRHPSDRARSSVVKFGEHNRELLLRLSRGERPDIWQTAGLTEDDYALIADFDFELMEPASASALFWYLRNRLYLRQALDRDPRSKLMCYEHFVADPEDQMRGLCRHLELAWDARMTQGIHARSVRCEWPEKTDAAIRERCDALYAELSSLA
jgi:hypothetical protein